MALLANIPDLPLPHWGHRSYRVSHSLFVNSLFLIAVLPAAFWPRARTAVGGWRVLAGGAAAWLSHLLLDSFYNHARGVAIFWPFGPGRLRLPMPWFSTLDTSRLLAPHNLRVAAIETAFYGGLLLACVLLRRWWMRPRDDGRPARTAVGR
jgi:membrane-bound metal-dependent hydrolase YbcI (DUF457 family)